MSNLVELLQQEIQRSGGAISFARFMELALYAPGLGYYSAGRHKLGKEGDFVTAPEISPLFAQCVARQCQQVLNELGGGDILEFGAGTGVFAKDLLLELEQLDCLPARYYILEVSADLRSRQQDLLHTHCPHLIERIQWLDRLPSAFQGIIFANEVMDAMPVHLFHIQNQAIQEKCVTWRDEQFAWALTQPTTHELTDAVAAIQEECSLANTYESEINLNLSAWIRSLADFLTQGVILLIDYGYGRREYYHPERSMGTLMCHHQHKRHADPLILVGEQDLTAHVDFTMVAESAVQAGLTVAGYTTQSAFLLSCGLLELANHPNLSARELANQNQAIKLLTLPSQMGEIVKVIALCKDIEAPLNGFSLFDRRRDL